jgi:hypothetical protein
MKTLIAIDEQGRSFPLQSCPLKGLLKAECCGHPDRINFNEVCKLMLSTTCPVRHRAARLLVTVEGE